MESNPNTNNTPKKSNNSKISLHSAKCNGTITLLNNEAKAIESHIQYKDNNSSDVDNYYGEGILRDHSFIRQGRGTYYYTNGSKYFGQWHNNLRIGVGVLIYSNGSMTFGEWDKSNSIGNSLVFWPSSSINEFSQAFIGKVTNSIPIEGLYFMNQSSINNTSQNNMSHYLYCGTLNAEGQKDDEGAFLYDFNRSFLFIGTIKKDIITMGYEVFLSKKNTIEDIVFIIRNPETNHLNHIINKDSISNEDRNLIYRRSNNFISNFLKEPDCIVDSLSTMYQTLLSLHKITKDQMPSEQTIEKMTSIKQKIKYILKKSLPKE